MANPICIEVPQVLDFCFQAETTDICLPVFGFVPIAPALTCTCATGNTVACSVVAVSCTEIVPAPGRVPSTTPGFFNVTFAISFSLAITLVSPTGVATCATFVTSSPFTKTVVLCAPDGAITVCEVTPACGLGICIDDVVCVSVNLCLVFKSVFPVVLSVIGTVLTPTLCVMPSPFPPICPPLPPTICAPCSLLT
ncbi:MAG TPA: hypothetical protein VMW83_06140 [Spirochaetia bacterium]|nr:hypothetical protein [Spirochaetia bacterium]